MAGGEPVRCRACGAKNRDHYEFCLRCGETLSLGGPPRSVAIGVPGRMILLIAGVTLLVVSAAVFRWMATGARSGPASAPKQVGPTPASEAESTSSPRAAVDIRDIREAARLGMAAYQAGDYTSALEQFQELLHSAPTHVTAHLYSGLCRMKLHELEEAERDIRRALELQPSNSLAVDSLVFLLRETGRLEEAESIQSRYAASHPRDADPLIGLGRIHREQGRLEQAIEDHRRAVQMAPNDLSALLELGVSLSEADEPGEAAEVFDKALRLDEANPDAHAGKGTALLLAGRFAEAVGPLEEAIRLDADRASVHLNLAMAYENLDRIEESLREYEAFIRLTEDRDRAARVDQLVQRARAALAERRARR